MQEALEHPYLAELHFDDDEPVAEPVSQFDFDFELYDLNKDDYKELIYDEIMLYQSDEKKAEYEQNKIDHPNGILF